jgi:hypothetical protein
VRKRLGTFLVFAVVLTAGALIGSAVTQWRPSEEPAADTSAVPATLGERVRVEVLNAGGRSGMAQRATDLLRARGFDVVYFGNAETFDQETSTVLDRVGRLEAARAVADALDIGAVRSEPDQDLYLDVTVRLGSAWKPAGTGAESGSTESRPWWDPRRILDGDEDDRR